MSKRFTASSLCAVFLAVGLAVTGCADPSKQTSGKQIEATDVVTSDLEEFNSKMAEAYEILDRIAESQEDPYLTERARELNSEIQKLVRKISALNEVMDIDLSEEQADPLSEWLAAEAENNAITVTP